MTSLAQRNWRLIEYSAYSVPSLVTRSVLEEVTLFCNSRSSQTPHKANPAGILARWLLEPFADHTFTMLSGGTLKYLLVGLQVEACPESSQVIAVNIQHELDAHHVTTLVANASEQGVIRIVFAEESVHQLEAKLGYTLDRVTIDTLLME